MIKAAEGTLGVQNVEWLFVTEGMRRTSGRSWALDKFLKVGIISGNRRRPKAVLMNLGKHLDCTNKILQMCFEGGW